MKTYKLQILITLFLISISSCKNETVNQQIDKSEIIIKDTELSQKTDSIELTKLIRNVYKWQMNNNLDDFPYEYDQIADTIFKGINWAKYQKNITEFKKTNFFSNNFLENHKRIASNLDKSIRKTNIKWRNINDGIPIWETNANNWCGCQDYPNEYWNNLVIDSLKIENENASFIWNWDKTYHHGYKMTAKKENGKWKVNTLSGFNYFYTVEEYDKMIEKLNN